MARDNINAVEAVNGDGQEHLDAPWPHDPAANMQAEIQTPDTIELFSSWSLQGDVLAVRTGREDGLFVEVFIFSTPHTGNANPLPTRTFVPKEGNLKLQTRNMENLRRIYKSQLQYACDQINAMASSEEHLATPIATESDAQGFFFALDQRGQLFHPEDDPSTIVKIDTGAPVFTPDQVELVRMRLQEAYSVMDDPCEYVLDLLRPATDEERSDGPRR